MSEHLRYRWALFGTLLTLVLPLWLVTYVPLPDMPFHLARVDMLVRYDELPLFQQLYERSFYPLPNMAIDLIGWALVKAGMPLLVAAQVFLTLYLAAFVLGCHWLAEAIHGRWTWAAVPAAFLAYNSTFIYGYINFNFALGMYLLALAGWVRWQGRWMPARVGIVTLGATACYLSHMGSFAFLGASAGILALWDVARARRISPRLLPGFVAFVPGVLLYSFGPEKAQEVERISLWEPWTKKGLQLLSPVLGYSTGVDLLVTGLAVAAAAVAYLGTPRRILWPWMSQALFFFALYLTFPSHFHSGSDAHLRFLFPALLFALFAVPVELNRRRCTLLTALLALFLAVRVGSVALHWRTADRQLIESVKLWTALEEGSRIYPIFWGAADRDTNKQERHLVHATSYASIYRNVSTPVVAIRGLHPILERKPSTWRTIDPETPVEEIDWADLFANFDYIATVHVTGPFLDRILERAEPIGASGPITLYRIRK